MTPMVWHQGIHDKMGMQRMRREGVEGAPGLVPRPWTPEKEGEVSMGPGVALAVAHEYFHELAEGP